MLLLYLLLMEFGHSVVAGDVHEMLRKYQAFVVRVEAVVDVPVNLGIIDELLDDVCGIGNCSQIGNVPDRMFKSLVKSALSIVIDQFAI